MENNYKYQKSMEVAKICFNQYKSLDPFPDIKPALLNRDDIEKYVEKTGMIFPFRPEKLKAASYQVKLGTEALFWDEKDEKQHYQNLKEGRDHIRLRKNSITYVGLESTFLLPYYMAVRFNLCITHVHRGLLLGTGPLIDPGFVGKIMIPIHNLTPNDYIIQPGQDIVAVEFTKVSENPLWGNTDIDKRALEEKFKTNVKNPNPTFDDFMNSALPPGIDSVRSSLDAALNDAEIKIEKARKSTIKLSWSVGLSVFFGAIAVLYSCYTLVEQTNSVVSDSNNFVIEASKAYQDAFKTTIDEKAYNDLKLKTEKAIDDKYKIFTSENIKQENEFYEKFDTRLMHIANRVTSQDEYRKKNGDELRESIESIRKELDEIKESYSDKRLDALYKMLIDQQELIKKIEARK